MTFLAVVANQSTGDERASVRSEDQEDPAPDGSPTTDAEHEPTTTDAIATTSTSTETAQPVDDVAGGDGTTDTTMPPDEVASTTITTSPEVTTTTVCADSFDPGCGQFRWSGTSAPNRPMTLEIVLITEHPTAGKDFTVHVRGSDPDATPLRTRLYVRKAGEGGYPPPASCSERGALEAFGPWSPPAPRPGSIVVSRTKREAEPGTYWLSACATSTAWVYSRDGSQTAWCPGDGTTEVFEGWLCRDPYGDYATARLEIEIAPAP